MMDDDNEVMYLEADDLDEGLLEYLNEQCYAAAACSTGVRVRRLSNNSDSGNSNNNGGVHVTSVESKFIVFATGNEEKNGTYVVVNSFCFSNDVFLETINLHINKCILFIVQHLSMQHNNAGDTCMHAYHIQ